MGQQVVAVVAEAGALKLWVRSREGVSSRCADLPGSRQPWGMSAVGQARAVGRGVVVGAAGQVLRESFRGLAASVLRMLRRMSSKGRAKPWRARRGGARKDLEGA